VNVQCRCHICLLQVVSLMTWTTLRYGLRPVNIHQINSAVYDLYTLFVTHCFLSIKTDVGQQKRRKKVSGRAKKAQRQEFDKARRSPII
jgi:hypothetical protein